MIGLEGAAALICDRLASFMPAKTAELRARLSVTDAETLPDVITFEPRDLLRLGIEQWPAIMVVGQSTLSTMPLDELPEGVVYRVRYALRVFVWARASSDYAADLARKRLSLAVRELLLERATLGDSGRVDAGTVRESFSELAQDDTDATVAGSYLEVEVSLEELLRDHVPPLVTVDHAPVVDTTVIPPPSPTD